MAENLGALVAKLKLETDEFRKELRTAQRGLKGLDGSFKKSEGAVGKFTSKASSLLTGLAAGAIAGIGASIIGIGRSAIMASADFQTAMGGISAVTGATEAELAALSATARELGATTQFSASQAAEGMRLLGQAGFDANEIIGIMPGLLNLAAAGELSLGQAAGITAATLKQFGLEAGESARVADVLAAAAAAVNSDIQGLAGGLAIIGPVARDMGMSLERTTAILGVLTEQLGSSEKAGTAMRGAVIRLANPVGAAAKVLSDLGVSATNSDGSMRDMVEVMGELEAKGATVQERIQLFGAEVVTASSILANSAGQVDGLTTSLNKAGGAAEDMASKKLVGLNKATKEFSSAWESLMITLGDAGLQEAATAIVNFAKEITQITEKNIPAYIAAIRSTFPVLREFGSIVGTVFDTAGQFVADMIIAVDDWKVAFGGAKDSTEDLTDSVKFMEAELKKLGVTIPQGPTKSLKDYAIQLKDTLVHSRNLGASSDDLADDLDALPPKIDAAGESFARQVDDLKTWSTTVFGARDAIEGLEEAVGDAIDTNTAFHQSVRDSVEVVGDLEQRAKEGAAQLEDFDKGLEDAGISMENVGTQAEKTGGILKNQVSTVLTDLGRDLVDIALHGGSVKDVFVSMGESVLRLVSEQVMGLLLKQMTKLLDMIPGLSGLGGIFGGGGSGGGGGGGGGGIPSFGGDPITGAINAILTGIGLFQNARQETTLNAIELNTRETALLLGKRPDGGLLGLAFNLPFLVDSTDDMKATLWDIRAILRGGIAVTGGGGGFGGGGGGSGGGGGDTAVVVEPDGTVLVGPAGTPTRSTRRGGAIGIRPPFDVPPGAPTRSRSAGQERDRFPAGPTGAPTRSRGSGMGGVGVARLPDGTPVEITIPRGGDISDATVLIGRNPLGVQAASGGNVLGGLATGGIFTPDNPLQAATEETQEAIVESGDNTVVEIGTLRDSNVQALSQVEDRVGNVEQAVLDVRADQEAGFGTLNGTLNLILARLREMELKIDLDAISAGVAANFAANEGIS